LAKKFTDLSLKMIGQHFGGRDHTTVIHACQSVLNLMDIDKTFQDDVLELQKQIDFAA
jgi:chromosomal replication initiator protein